jgi:hypothetical protein
MAECEGCGSAEARIEDLKGQLTEKDELIACLKAQLEAPVKSQGKTSTSRRAQFRRYLNSRLRKISLHK